jgi:hypothetical protein
MVALRVCGTINTLLQPIDASHNLALTMQSLGLRCHGHQLVTAGSIIHST